MAIDPICQMTVDPASALKAEREGKTYYFCSEYCRQKFLATEAETTEPEPVTIPFEPAMHAAARYVCPMHPEVEQDRPGSCPICGMALEPRDFTAEEEGEDPELHDMTRRFWVALALGLPALVLGMLPMAGVPINQWLGRGFGWLQFVLTTPVVLWAGWPFFQRGWQSVFRRSLNMFSLIAIGVGAAYLYSLVALLWPGLFPASLHEHGYVGLYFEAAAAITILVLLGQVLELRARRQTRGAIRSLLALAPPTARRVEPQGVRVIPLAEVHVGDMLQILPGDRIPVDGLIVEGSSAVDESMMTGESIPVEKAPGDTAIGGTLNQVGSLRMRAERIGRDTMLARIVELVSEAQRSRAPIQRVADVVAAWFVPIVLAIALVTFVVWMVFGPEPRLTLALLNAVAVLIIACPCALGLATPMSIMVGMGRGAHEGVLIRSAEILEILPKVNVLVVDKTGTLTQGRPKVTECVAAVGFSENQVIQWAAAVEQNSEHPLARAVVEEARRRGLPLLPVADFRATPGEGVVGIVQERRVTVGREAILGGRAEAIAPTLDQKLRDLQGRGRTTMLVAVDDRHAGLVAVADPIKATTPEAVEILHRLGLQIVMLTGDHVTTAREVARQLGIDRFEAEVRPQDKLERVRALRRGGQVVAMAGDGVNDAPALAEADVGIAMGTGSDVAIASADVTLVRGDLRGIVRAVLLSRQTMRNIRQNLFFAFIYNIVGVPIAAGLLYPFAGILLSPVIAAAAMSFSSVSVVFNALRLRTVRL